MLLGLIAVYAVGITRDLWESDGAWIVGQSMVTAAITLFAVLFYIAAFMALAFPAIPEQFGGGEGNHDSCGSLSLQSMLRAFGLSGFQ